MLPVSLSIKASRIRFRLLFCLLAIIVNGAFGAQSKQLTLRKFIKLDSLTVNRAIAITCGKTGEIYLLDNFQSQVTIIEVESLEFGRYQPGFAVMGNATDIASDGGTGILVCDPFQSIFAHLSRTGSPLPEIALDPAFRLQAVSIASLRDGRVLLYNRNDNNLWRMERDGKATRLTFGNRSRAARNLKLEISPDQRRIYLLQGAEVSVFSAEGATLSPVAGSLEEPAGIAVTDQGLWLAGDGVEFIPTNPDWKSYKLPPDSLLDWDIPAVADIAIDGETLFLLAAQGSRIAVLNIITTEVEQP